MFLPTPESVVCSPALQTPYISHYHLPDRLAGLSSWRTMGTRTNQSIKFHRDQGTVIPSVDLNLTAMLRFYI